MKTIVVGCPYTGAFDIQSAICALDSLGTVRVINTSEVISVGLQTLTTASETIDVTDVVGSFVRYPYDMIPPHSGTFVLREATEFYKSVALIVNSAAINPVEITWMLRNRIFSLSQVQYFGANIPPIDLVMNSLPIPFGCGSGQALKAIGNCFVSDHVNELSLTQRCFVTLEEDGGQWAAVLEARSIDNQEIGKYIAAFRYACIQRQVSAWIECRCYLIGSEFYLYEREGIDRFDKSFAPYRDTAYELRNSTKDAILLLASRYRLGFICFDLIVDKEGVEWVIDVNPYGSLPLFADFPEPTNAIARLLLELSR